MVTMCKFKSGLSDMPAAVSRSLFRPYADRELHANPLQNLHLSAPPKTGQFKSIKKSVNFKLLL